LLLSTFSRFLPKALQETYILDLKQVKIPLIMPDPKDIRITVARMLMDLLGLGFSLWYAVTRHFLAQNGMALVYSIEVRMNQHLHFQVLCA
jgi:hypothetical protein